MPNLTLNTSFPTFQAFSAISLLDFLLQCDLRKQQLRMYGSEKVNNKVLPEPLNMPMIMIQIEQDVLAIGKPSYSGSDQSITVRSSSCSISSQESLFTDMGLFARCVRKATYDLYDSLGVDQKALVHWHIWDLAGRPDTNDSNWGQNHLSENVLRFVDALARATQN